ncbi:homeobox-leucine zipper protein ANTHOCYANINLESS 2-like [Tasmannia lanceolata]|uniref:homeobox-leucine zipper protein ANTHOCYANINLESS 2-like n=1 Tax=Tasmannia lanceolata TaxID=3420 RepID=UPI00406363D9
MQSGGIPQPRLPVPTIAESMFSSPGLSLAPPTGRMAQIGRDLETSDGKSRDEEYDSKSGSDNLDGGLGDDKEVGNPKKKKSRYHRHTPLQIQELENLFKECAHPDEKQREELGKELSLDNRQVKFWFQNRRTQMKNQLERHENAVLRQENDKLRDENMMIRESVKSPICRNCGGTPLPGELSLEEQHLRLENAHLKAELDRLCVFTGKFMGQPVSIMANSVPPPMLNLTGFGIGTDFGGGVQSGLPVMGMDRSVEKSLLLDLALAAMDEFLKMVQCNAPLWVPSMEGGRELLNYEEYLRVFPRCIGAKPAGFVTEATREEGMVIINGLALVETLMDSNRWAEMFPCIIARATTTQVIFNGMGGTKNGALQLMHAELQVPSPMVPVRDVNFLRFCKQLAEGVWAVVDVSTDGIRENQTGLAYVKCRRLPSGCVVQDMPNGCSKVTWVEHVEYDEGAIHQLYRSLINSGMGFGAHRWIATLQRQCECLATLMSSSIPTGRNIAAITLSGRRSMVKLAQRMTKNFCVGVCASTVHQWNKLCAGNLAKDVRVMTRRSVDNPGEPAGLVLSGATSLWLPIPPHRVFDFLRDERFRREWDILSNGGPMQEVAHIAKGQDPGNTVSLLRACAMNPNQTTLLILQETCIDAAGSFVVYAPVDIPAMNAVMNGGDSSYVALLPSGFAIVPDRFCGGAHTSNGSYRVDGSLLTVAFQILINSLPAENMTMEPVETINNLISGTIQKIKAALHCEN